jgi:DNA-binding NarL/FixJ family response regulator
MEANGKARPRNQIHVYLIVQNRLMREALARLFQKQSDLMVVGVNPPGEIAPGELLNTGCNVLVSDSLDTVSAIVSAIGLMADQEQVHSEIKSILFGMDDNEEYFVKAVREGISGYLLKEASSNEIVSAVRSVARGEAVCPGRLCMALFHECSRGFRQKAGLADDAAGLKAGLTFRQRQLLSLIAKGMSNKEIASSLNLSECTVKNHVYRIMKQVDAESRQDAVDLVRSGGYVLKPS